MMCNVELLIKNIFTSINIYDQTGGSPNFIKQNKKVIDDDTTLNDFNTPLHPWIEHLR